MDRDAMASTIYDTFAAPYGEYITPALRQQFRICAYQAADRVRKAQQQEHSKNMDPLDRSIRDRHIIELYESGMSIDAVAREVGMTPQGVRHVFQRSEQARPRTVKVRKGHAA